MNICLSINHTSSASAFPKINFGRKTRFENYRQQMVLEKNIKHLFVDYHLSKFSSILSYISLLCCLPSFILYRGTPKLKIARKVLCKNVIFKVLHSCMCLKKINYFKIKIENNISLSFTL